MDGVQHVFTSPNGSSTSLRLSPLQPWRTVLALYLTSTPRRWSGPQFFFLDSQYAPGFHEKKDGRRLSRTRSATDPYQVEGITSSAVDRSLEERVWRPFSLLSSQNLQHPFVIRSNVNSSPPFLIAARGCQLLRFQCRNFDVNIGHQIFKSACVQCCKLPVPDPCR